MASEGKFEGAIDIVPFSSGIGNHGKAVLVVPEIVGFSFVPVEPGEFFAGAVHPLVLLFDVIAVDVSQLHELGDDGIVFGVTNERESGAVLLTGGDGTGASLCALVAGVFVVDAVGGLLVARRGLGSSRHDRGTWLTGFGI